MSWIDDNKGQGPWSFSKQPEKRGYVNNPLWTSTPADTSKHEPCGYWPKGTVKSTLFSTGWDSCPQAVTIVGSSVWFVTTAETEPDVLYIIKYDFESDQWEVLHEITDPLNRWDEPEIALETQGNVTVLLLKTLPDVDPSGYHGLDIYVFHGESLVYSDLLVEEATYMPAGTQYFNRYFFESKKLIFLQDGTILITIIALQADGNYDFLVYRSTDSGLSWSMEPVKFDVDLDEYHTDFVQAMLLEDKANSWAYYFATVNAAGTNLSDSTIDIDMSPGDVELFQIERKPDNTYRLYHHGKWGHLFYCDTSDTNLPDTSNLGALTKIIDESNTNNRFTIARSSSGKYRIYYGYNFGDGYQLGYQETTDTNLPDETNLGSRVLVGDYSTTISIYQKPDGTYRIYYSDSYPPYYLQYSDTTNTSLPDNSNIGSPVTMDWPSSSYVQIIDIGGVYRMYVDGGGFDIFYTDTTDSNLPDENNISSDSLKRLSETAGFDPAWAGVKFIWEKPDGTYRLYFRSKNDTGTPEDERQLLRFKDTTDTNLPNVAESEMQLQKSTDSGQTWSEVNNDVTNSGNVIDVRNLYGWCIFDSDIYFFCPQYNAAMCMLKSTDNGVTFTVSTPEDFSVFDISTYAVACWVPDNGNLYVAALRGYGKIFVLKSADGSNFVHISTIGFTTYSANRQYMVSVDGNNVALTAYDAKYDTPGGTWASNPMAFAISRNGGDSWVVVPTAFYESEAGGGSVEEGTNAVVPVWPL